MIAKEKLFVTIAANLILISSCILQEGLNSYTKEQAHKLKWR